MANIVFAGRDWLWPAAILCILGIVGVWLSYRNSGLPFRHLATAFTLKTLGLTALAFCLLEPLWTSSRAKPGANYFAVVADNSQGMQLRDRGASQSRAEYLRHLLAHDQADWQNSLRENFELRRYLFDSRLHDSKDFSELIFDGRATALAHSLRTLAERYRGRPLAGILLFTDGNATDLPAGLPDLSGLPPIYPVVIGQDHPAKDIGLQKIAVTQTAFEDAPVTIQVSGLAAGYKDNVITAQLFDQSGKKVAEETTRTSQDPEPLQFRFQIRPEQSGLSFYRVRLAAQNELSHFDHPENSPEATLFNNERTVVVDRGKGPYRILYIAGRPNWEYKFLKRAIDEDDQTQLVGIIRIAKREPKFEFRGRSGETSNPLFRGFDRKDEETERYDQPVLIRLNTRDAAELSGGFPKTAEELYPYHAVILDDLESEFFTHDQMALLQKFVSERGGGFLMLGGQESFSEGKFERTPIGDMLPVYLNRLADYPPPSSLRLNLTREGWLQPWTRLRATETEETDRLNDLPPFQVLNLIREPKPGASVLATVSDPSGRHYPALIVQRYGHGRAAAMTIGDLWRSGLRSDAMQRDLARSWRQVARWLVADVPNRVEIHAEPTFDADQSILLQVRARDPKFQPLDNATVTIEVSSLNSAPPPPTPTATNSPPLSVRLHAEAASAEPGLYQSSFIMRDTAVYKAQAIVTDASGLEVGRAEAGWTANPAAEEFRALTPNRALLEKIAQNTGGEIVAPDQLNTFARALPKRTAPITESWTMPLWHTPVLFLFALACLLTEWGLRRWKGLP